jgi:hypothetical protein
VFVPLAIGPRLQPTYYTLLETSGQHGCDSVELQLFLVNKFISNEATGESFATLGPPPYLMVAQRYYMVPTLSSSLSITMPTTSRPSGPNRFLARLATISVSHFFVT